MKTATAVSVLLCALSSLAAAESTNGTPTSSVTALSSSFPTASPVSNNPVGPVYVATLPTNIGTVQGSISATADTNGNGVRFTVNLSNLPSSGGPFRKFPLQTSAFLFTSHTS